MEPDQGLEDLWKKKDPYTREEALRILQDSDHSFLTVEKATQVGAAFGFTPTVEREQANVHIKGLTKPAADTGKWFEGVSGERLAEGIARTIDPDFQPTKIGRGFRLRDAVEAIARIVEVYERA